MNREDFNRAVARIRSQKQVGAVAMEFKGPFLQETSYKAEDSADIVSIVRVYNDSGLKNLRKHQIQLRMQGGSRKNVRPIFTLAEMEDATGYVTIDPDGACAEHGVDAEEFFHTISEKSEAAFAL